MVSEEKGIIRVVLIDDEEDFLELAERFLEKDESKIDLTMFRSAPDALDLIKEGNFDAVVSDYKMPRMNGIELLKELRKDGNDIPFILLTGKGKEEVAMEALNEGADRYLIKIGNPEKQFRNLTKFIVEEVVRKKSERELKTFQKWIKNVLEYESE